VPLSEQAKAISAFAAPDGLYQHTVMPFGMLNAVATFQQMINHIIAGLGSCAAYLDDVVEYNQTFEDHILPLLNLFNRLKEANLTIKLMKSEF